MKQRPRLTFFAGGLLFVVCSFLLPMRGYGYVMPSEQIVGLMVRNFSNLNTMVVTQYTNHTDRSHEGREKVFREKIWLKAPNLYHAKALEKTELPNFVPDVAYRQLLIANSVEAIMQLLGDLGIDLQAVAFTRFDGAIAYRIGHGDPESPKIIVEKDRFLPLHLVYQARDDQANEIIKVQFADYRKLEPGWYPFQITYSHGTDITQKSATLAVQANVPVAPSVFGTPSPAGERAPSDREGKEEEERRLKNILETFEDKYR
jgi:hypothetical protein